MHNALQGGEIDLSKIKKEIFEQVIYENSVRNFLDHDFIIVHDPQPLPLIEHYEKKSPWLWRCHLDLSGPDAETWQYLRRWIDNYDAVILSCEEFAQEMKPPQRVMMPAIDPFTIKNRQLSDREINERLARYEIPTDLPLVVQVSRFDPWKDPKGVVDAFKFGPQTNRRSAGAARQFCDRRPGRRRNFPLALRESGRADTNSDQWRRHSPGKRSANACSGCPAKIVA